MVEVNESFSEAGCFCQANDSRRDFCRLQTLNSNFLPDQVKEMITGEVMQQVIWLRANAKSFCDSVAIPLPIPYTLYQDCLGQMLQESQRLELQNSTKYLARKYFDIFLAKNPSISHEHLILLIITCLRTAVKFSQNATISSQYTLQYAIQQSGGLYSHQQFCQCEKQLLSCMEYKMNIPTPEDFMGVLKLFPNQFSEDKLNHLIDFLLMQPEIRGVSAEQIFFTCVMYLCQKLSASPLCLRILEALAIKMDECRHWAGFLQQQLNLIIQG